MSRIVWSNGVGSTPRSLRAGLSSIRVSRYDVAARATTGLDTGGDNCGHITHVDRVVPAPGPEREEAAGNPAEPVVLVAEIGVMRSEHPAGLDRLHSLMVPVGEQRRHGPPGWIPAAGLLWLGRQSTLGRAARRVPTVIWLTVG
ncbi:MAG: hypothetical protein ACRDO2_09055 [Nocardioidaceae bacterium]